MALQLEKGLARLPYVKDADNIGVLGKCSQEMGIVWRCGKTQQRRRVSHSLLGLGRTGAP